MAGSLRRVVDHEFDDARALVEVMVMLGVVAAVTVAELRSIPEQV